MPLLFSKSNKNMINSLKIVVVLFILLVIIASCYNDTKRSEATVEYTIAIKLCNSTTWDTITYNGTKNTRFFIYVEGNRTKVSSLATGLGYGFIASNVCLFKILNIK